MKIRLDLLSLALLASFATGCFSPNTHIKKMNETTDRVHTSPVVVGYRKESVTNITSSASGTVTNVSVRDVPITQDVPDGRITTEECSVEQKSFVRKWFPWLCSSKGLDCPNDQKCSTSTAAAFSGGSWQPAAAFSGYNVYSAQASVAPPSYGYGVNVGVAVPIAGGGVYRNPGNGYWQVQSAIGNGAYGPYGYHR